MKENIEKRFDALLGEGYTLVNSLPPSGTIIGRFSPGGGEQRYRAWLMSTANLIQTVTTPGDLLFLECERILATPELKHYVTDKVFLQMYGLLKAAQNEWNSGLLQKIEYAIVAGTFDDFLDHADFYHKGNKKIEASVLASAVLEDTVKKIATKNGINPSGQSLGQLIDELVKSGVFTPVKAKRARAYSGIRNSALHAEWDDFDIRDVGQLISGTRELIEEYL